MRRREWLEALVIVGICGTIVVAAEPQAAKPLTMQQKIDELEAAYKKCFGNRLDCFEAFYAF